MSPVLLALVAAALAQVAGMLSTRLSRPAWAFAAAATAAWLALTTGLVEGGIMLVGVVLATTLELPTKPTVADFNSVVARLAAIAAGAASALVLVFRVLSADPVSDAALMLLTLNGVMAFVHVVAQDGAAEESRAARAALVVAAAAWAAGGHPGLATLLVVAVLLCLVALAPRWRTPA